MDMGVNAIKENAGVETPLGISDLLLSSDSMKISADLARSFLNGSPFIFLPTNESFTKESSPSPSIEFPEDSDGLEEDPLKIPGSIIICIDDETDEIPKDSFADEIGDCQIGKNYLPDIQEVCPEKESSSPIPESKIPLTLSFVSESENEVGLDEILSSTINNNVVGRIVNAETPTHSSSEDEVYYDCQSNASDNKENTFRPLHEGNDASRSEIESDCSNFEFDDGLTPDSDKVVADDILGVSSNLKVLIEVTGDKTTEKLNETSSTTIHTNENKSMPPLTTDVEGKEIDALIGPTNQFEELVWLVKFRHKRRFDLVPAACMNQFFPDKVIRFYERRICFAKQECSVIV